MILIGIDYSITSPAATFINTEMVGLMGYTTHIPYDCCHSIYVTDRTSCLGTKSVIGYLQGLKYPEWENQQERFDNLSDIFMEYITNYASGNKIHVFLEGYSYGSKGKVFHIAENTGILKHKLYMNGIGFTEVPPSNIKKWATGKGNANKELMEKHFNEQHTKFKAPLRELIGMGKVKSSSPISDIIDSYYIVDYAYNHLYVEKSVA